MRNVALLAALVSATEQHDYRIAARNEVHAVPGTVVNAQLRHPAADGTNVAEQPQRKTPDRDVHPRSGYGIAEAGDPPSEIDRLTNFDRRVQG